MGLFNSSNSWYVGTTVDVQKHQLWFSDRFSVALFLSVGLHVGFMLANLHDSNQPSLLTFIQAPHDFKVKLNGSSETTSSSRQESQKERVLSDFMQKDREQPRLVTEIEPRIQADQEAQALNVEPLTNASSEPIQGLAIGSVSFTGFGGSRKRPFELVGSSVLQTQQYKREDPRLVVGSLAAQTITLEIKNELNRKMPADEGQICFLDAQVNCQKHSTVLEKYLQSKSPMLQQLLVGAVMKVSWENGLWRVDLQTRPD